MATKKIKRFQEGGMSDKERGLEASKDEKVGFFERLRMGNIDDEGSEAYRRFGAGRGKAERTPVETRTATPVVREAAKAETAQMDPLEEANAREPIPVPAGPRATPSAPVRTSAAKAAPAKPAMAIPAQTYTRRGGATAEDRAMQGQTYRRTGGATAEDRMPSSRPQSRKGTMEDIPRDTDMPTVKGERTSGSDLSRNVANTISALGPGKLAGIGAIGMEMRGAEAARKAAAAKRSAQLSGEMKSKAQPTKFTSKPKATQKNPAKKTKKFDDSESSIEFKRGGKAYASGGSVSAASKRADGIASRGKTRCKIC